MKLILFLSALSIFTFVHVCKAGPLRLFKRAAFYIANETACVVDGIVYSNGEPIPTEEPCEACKCRPPGFACVLKDCKVKPGCRAIRRLGECCPDYVCGCEHNGRMYQDGDEIRDPRNPCYLCHCQGSSIACALAECFFRDDCDSEFVPGECCPKYVNCTIDVPDNIPPSQGNVLPTINLLPALNGESYLVEEFPSTSKTPEETISPTQPPQLSENINETESHAETPAETSSEAQPSETVSLVTEENRLVFNNEDIDTEVKETSNDNNVNVPEDSVEDKEANKTESETKVLFNSETNISEEGDKETESIKDDSPQPTEVVDITEPQTTVINEAEITEKSTETESASTDIPVEQKIKSSASENAKSLKLSDDDQSKDPEKKEEEQSDELKITNSEAPETSSEASSETQTLNSKDSSTDSIDKETLTSSQATPVNSSSEKIKPESTETVTVVFHINERPKLTTETDFLNENTTQLSTNEAQGDLLKSNGELETSDGNDESSNSEKTESTGKNFEIFPTTEPQDDLTTKSSSEDQKSEVQARTDETDTITSEASKENEEITENKDVSSDSKDMEISSVTITNQNVNDVSETRTDEVKEEKKTSDPKVTVIKIDPNGSVRIEITESKDETQKAEEPTEKSVNEETTSEEVLGETQSEGREAESDQTKNEEKSTSLENIQLTTVQNTEEPTVEGNAEPSTPLENQSSSTQTDNLPEERAEDTEASQNIGITETAETDEGIPEEIPKSEDQETEEPKQSD